MKVTVALSLTAGNAIDVALLLPNDGAHTRPAEYRAGDWVVGVPLHPTSAKTADDREFETHGTILIYRTRVGSYGTKRLNAASAETCDFGGDAHELHLLRHEIDDNISPKRLRDPV